MPGGPTNSSLPISNRLIRRRYSLFSSAFPSFRSQSSDHRSGSNRRCCLLHPLGVLMLSLRSFIRSFGPCTALLCGRRSTRGSQKWLVAVLGSRVAYPHGVIVLIKVGKSGIGFDPGKILDWQNHFAATSNTVSLSCEPNSSKDTSKILDGRFDVIYAVDLLNIAAGYVEPAALRSWYSHRNNACEYWVAGRPQSALLLLRVSQILNCSALI